MRGSPQPPSSDLTSFPPLLPFLFHTPSAVLSSSLWARPKKPPEQLPSQELPSPKLIQTAGTLWPIWGASILKRWREMEMVPPAIYSLPQFGLSDLLSTHPGNNDPCMQWPFDSEFSLNFWLEGHTCIAPDFNRDFPSFSEYLEAKSLLNEVITRKSEVKTTLHIVLLILIINLSKHFAVHAALLLRE